MDRTALDWLFSTAPQAIAALVGLIFTGVAFIIGAIDKEAARDDTKAEICEAMKKDIHSKMKWLYWIAGVTIVLDLLVLATNPIEEDKVFSLSGTFDCYLFVGSILLLLNFITVGFSLWFIVRLANPKFFKETAHRMLDMAEGGDVDIKDYIAEFIELEKALRELPLNVTIEAQQVKRNASVSDMLRELRFKEWLNAQNIDDLYRLNRLRNLAVHGAGIDSVSNSDLQEVRYYTQKLKEIKNKL